MPGTHYTLDREKKARRQQQQAEMDKARQLQLKYQGLVKAAQKSGIAMPAAPPIAQRNPMLDHPEKACIRCGVVKLNDFANFGKKWFGDRNTYTTQDICAQCKSEKLSATMLKKAEDARKARQAAEDGGFLQAAVVVPHVPTVKVEPVKAEPSVVAKQVAERRSDFELRAEVGTCPHEFTTFNANDVKICAQCGKEL